MASKQGSVILQGILETDETYLGGKPSTNSHCKVASDAPRGRGTTKLAVLGVVQRRGQVFAQVADDLTGAGIVKFLKKAVNPEGSHLIAGGFTSYRSVRPFIKHSVFRRSYRKFRRGIHTNVIEGFWSGFKRSWYGSHHSYRKKYAPLYIDKSFYKYNIHNNLQAFDTFIRGCFEIAA